MLASGAGTRDVFMVGWFVVVWPIDAALQTRHPHAQELQHTAPWFTYKTCWFGFIEHEHIWHSYYFFYVTRISPPRRRLPPPPLSLSVCFFASPMFSPSKHTKTKRRLYACFRSSSRPWRLVWKVLLQPPPVPAPMGPRRPPCLPPPRWRRGLSASWRVWCSCCARR